MSRRRGAARAFDVLFGLLPGALLVWLSFNAGGFFPDAPALVALGNSGAEELRGVAERYAAGDDELLREHAEWALERLDQAAR